MAGEEREDQLVMPRFATGVVTGIRSRHGKRRLVRSSGQTAHQKEHPDPGAAGQGVKPLARAGAADSRIPYQVQVASPWRAEMQSCHRIRGLAYCHK
jgi:hypothetical protein